MIALLFVLGLVMAQVPVVGSEALPAPPVERPCVPLGADDQLSVDMDEARLFDVARLVSCALEKNLLFQPPTLGDKRVSVLAPKPIGRAQLEQLWRALLTQHGLVEERHGAFEVVRPLRNAR